MTRTIESQLTSKLKLSIAVQLLDNFITSEYHRFYTNSEDFSEDELENLFRAIVFWEAETGKVKGYKGSIANELEKL